MWQALDQNLAARVIAICPARWMKSASVKLLPTAKSTGHGSDCGSLSASTNIPKFRNISKQDPGKVSYFVCSFDRDVNTKYNLWIAGTVVLQDSMILKFAFQNSRIPGISPAQAAVVLAACVRGLCSPMAVLAVRSKSISWGGSPLRPWYRLDVQFKTHHASSIYVIIQDFADGFLKHFGPLPSFFPLPELCGQTHDTLTLTLLCSPFASLLSPSVWQNVFQD